MSDFKLLKEYEDAALSLAISEMLDEYGKELTNVYKDEEKISPSSEALEKFETAMKKESKKGQRKTFLKSLAKAGKNLITVAAAVIIVLSISIVSVDALRFRFLEWLIGVHESHSYININRGDNNMSNDHLSIDKLPAGYILTSYSNIDDKITFTYQKSDYEIMVYVYPYDYSFSSDTENIVEEKIYINNYEGIYKAKETISGVYWFTESNSCQIRTNDPSISKENLVEIAQSLN